MDLEEWKRENESAGLVAGLEDWQKENAIVEDAPIDDFEAWRQESVSLNLAPEIEEDRGFGAFASEFGKGLASMSLRAGRAFIGTGETAIKYFPGIPQFAMRKLYEREMPVYDIATGIWERKTGFEVLREAKEDIALTEDKFPMTHRGTAAWAGRVLGEAIPFMALALAAGYTIGPVAGPMMTGFTIEGDIAYEEAKKKPGVTEAQAQFERFVVGSINGALEAWQIGNIMRFHTTGRHTLKNFVRLARSKSYKLMAKEGIGFSGDVLKLSVQEAAQEFAQEGVSITVPALTRRDIPRTPEGQIDFIAIGGRLGQAALGGGLVGGVFGAGGAVFATIPQVARPTDVEIDSSLTRIQESKLNVGEKARLSKQLELLREEPREVPRTDLDDSIDKLNNAIEEIEELRPIEAEQISKELGKRFADFSDILQGEPNPIIAQRIARSALSGRLKMVITPFIEGTFTETDAMPLYDAVRNSTLLEGEKISAFDGLNNLIFEGAIPARHEIGAMGEVFGRDFTEALIKKRRQLGISKWETAMNVINIPRAILASYDMSAPLRQGLLMLPLAPKQWIKAVGHGYRAFTSPQFTDFVDMQIRTHPYYNKLQRSGLFQSRIGTLTQGEEYFRGQMGDKIPYLGAGIRASERAYTTFLNSVRAQVFYKFCEKWEGTGKSAQDYRDLAGFLNHATGRGDPKWLDKHVDIFNIMFFAPKLLVGRVQVISDLFTTTSPVRKIIAADLLEGVGMGLLILTLASMIKGVEIEKNPLSTDFGKIRIGATRIDFWGGYQQIARYTVQFLAGMRKTTETKRIVPQPRGATIWRFIQSKLSPPAGFALDLGRGETFLGRKLTPVTPQIIGRETYERFMPMFLQDVVDAARFQGMSGLAIVTPTALHGVGAMTYPITAKGEEIKTKNALSQHYFGQQWDELSPTFQEAIRVANSHIELMEERSRMDRENWSFMERIGEQEAEAARNIHRRLPDFVQNELDTYYVRITGLSRIISGDWVLNDERYKQYQERTAFILQKALPTIILNANYRNFSFENKRLVLQNIIDIAKRTAREEIIRKANMSDLISREELMRKRLYRREPK